MGFIIIIIYPLLRRLVGHHRWFNEFSPFFPVLHCPLGPVDALYSTAESEDCMAGEEYPSPPLFQPFLEVWEGRHPCMCSSFVGSDFIANDTVTGIPDVSTRQMMLLWTTPLLDQSYSHRNMVHKQREWYLLCLIMIINNYILIAIPMHVCISFFRLWWVVSMYTPALCSWESYLFFSAESTLWTGSVQRDHWKLKK